MAIKTWVIEADTIAYDSVELWMGEDGLLHVRRPYRFLTSEGVQLTETNKFKRI